MLTDLDKQFLKDFIANKEMCQAVKKWCELQLTEDDRINPRVNDYARKYAATLSNEDLGANLRARVIALEALEVVFGSLSSLTPLTKPKTINPPR